MTEAPSKEIIPSGATTKPIVQVHDVSKIYRLREETVYALNKVSLTIYQGEYLSIMGPSGSGKSTLFNIVGALDNASEGYAQIGDIRLTHLTPRQLSHVRCNYIGYIFQAFNLIPSLTALRNVALPCIFMGVPPEEADKRAAEVLTQVGLGHRLDHTPGELSGGQQQRVAIARALINDPCIILADEPTANLDLQTGSDVIQILKNLSVERGVTIITATHDHKMLSQSDRVVRIREGQIEAIQNRDELEIEEGTIEFAH
ncbi:MAG: ABC transporter ATP-binding protein [Verrucomicrobia bacterium]|nr:ABC transporter ATP-binding protein [Verrucomicrobiota bacterium]MCH8526638.1 ABC transporter ATP-binding protein [Kiritimatiellia bacterium]